MTDLSPLEALKYHDRHGNRVARSRDYRQAIDDAIAVLHAGDAPTRKDGAAEARTASPTSPAPDIQGIVAAGIIRHE